MCHKLVGDLFELDVGVELQRKRRIHEETIHLLNSGLMGTSASEYPDLALESFELSKHTP